MVARPIKILLIEDSASDRRVYRRFLGRTAYEILEAETGQAAIAACREHSPSCIILDFRLPDMDGLQVLDELRKLTRAPVILISGQPSPLMQSQGFRQGIVRYLSKDFLSSEALLAAIREALE